MSRALHAVALSVLAAAVLVPAAPAQAVVTSPPITISATQLHLIATYRGNGHGHGMSQYGAFGAAKKGLTYSKIVAFYYPGTKISTVSTSARIRVRITAAGRMTTVAAESGLMVSGITAALPTTGIAKYRLVANSTSGLALQKLPTGSTTWLNVAGHTSLADNAEFHRVGYAAVRLYLTGGSSTRYYGVLRATRISPTDATKGVLTINRVTYDKYTQGVVPREVPASWPAAAVDAQAVAARTYADFQVHDPINPDYDICDSSQCQVYGGHVHYFANGTVDPNSVDYPPAASDTSNQVLRYNTQPVFAQFSASNGGWTVAGTQPYLVAKQDPYDIATYDPYINAKKTITVASLAKAFGLPKLTKLVITRDGHGTWGGRVLTVSAYNGTTHVDKDGAFLQGALGLGTTWIQLTPTV